MPYKDDLKQVSQETLPPDYTSFWLFLQNDVKTIKLLPLNNLIVMVSPFKKNLPLAQSYKLLALNCQPGLQKYDFFLFYFIFPRNDQY